MRRYEAHGGEHHADSRQGDRFALTIVKVTEVRAKGVHATKQNSMNVTVKEVTSIVSATQSMATTTGATPGQHLPSDITTVIPLTIQTRHRTTTSLIAPLQPLWPRTMLITNSTRRQLWSIPVLRGTFSTICPSSTNSSLSLKRLSSWATTRQPTVLRLESLCATCLTGVVSALPKSFMCPASPSTSLACPSLQRRSSRRRSPRPDGPLLTPMMATAFWQRQVSRSEASSILLRLFVVQVSLLALSLPLRHHRLLFCRPDQCSLTNRYVDDNICLISE
jgi:hypothetical protein